VTFLNYFHTTLENNNNQEGEHLGPVNKLPESSKLSRSLQP